MYIYIYDIYINIYIYIYNIYIYIYSKRQTMCPPSYYQSTSGLMAIHALGHMMYVYTLLVPMNQTVFNKSSKEHNKTG